ncbi:adenylyl cyclase-associated protein [Wuchereria bancrofti]|uniref:Adenylyl cyclase-associated protein n=1 Tax=Wuchereria bancrofti TaxID=6293 RepID=J9FEQ5_WUCBA|nr:adenylyl cyclase-associated protein [Wuchereria bancrofti]
MGPLQRRTSDPTLMKINGNELPENIAMFNVAKGVRAELEQDPKFRKRADILGSQTAAEPIAGTTETISLIATNGKFFQQNVQQFHNVLDTKRSPPVPSAKPFNVEHVRSIFRTKNAIRTDSIPLATSGSVEAKVAQDNMLLEKPIKRSVEIHEVQGRMPHAKLKEDIRTSGIVSQYLTDTSQNTESTGSATKLVEQKVCSVSETSKENIQPKPTTFIIDKPVITDKSPEIQKEITILQDQPIVSQDIAVLEKDYDSHTTFVKPRRLNQPFPVDDATFISGSGKPGNVMSLPGILMKDGNSIRSVNDSGIKTSKKVAFQCDKDSKAFTKKESEESKTSAETPLSVVQYDDAVDEPLQRLLKLSVDIGGDLQTVGNKLSALFTEQRNFIWLAAGQSEPSIKELQAKLGPMVKMMEDLSIFKESKRNTPFFNHISAASEGIQALGWLTVKPTPAPFIKDMFEASMFFVNRVLKEYKDDRIHTEWAKSWSDVLNALQKYVRQVHTTGLVWNSCPGAKPPALVSPNSTLSGAASAPPPPPVLPPDFFAAVSSETNISTDKSDRSALFAQINAGEEITKRLKKVTPDMQTHKNPALRSQHKKIDARTQDKEMALTATDGALLVKKQEDKPPKTWLDNGKQWNVEYYKNNSSVMVEVSDMKQTVYVFKCENSIIQIKGKVNSVTLDSCKKTSVVFDSLLSQLEVINCQSVQIQTLGAMPTLSIQKTDGCQVYLSKSAINAEIITSKSSEMNVLVPGAEDGDFVEFAVPEQFKTVYDGKKLKTTVSDIC